MPSRPDMPDMPATYDLIIIRADMRIALHEHYDSPAERLENALDLLTTRFDLSDDTLRDIDALRDTFTHHEPDAVLNQVAKIARRMGLHVYMSTTQKSQKTQQAGPAAPKELYTVCTQYISPADPPKAALTEHFTSVQARLTSLQVRADDILRGRVPTRVKHDEAALVELVNTGAAGALRLKLSTAVWNGSAYVTIDEDEETRAARAENAPAPLVLLAPVDDGPTSTRS